jgi:hypothetical protein
VRDCENPSSSIRRCIPNHQLHIPLRISLWRMHQPRLDNVDKCLIASGIIEYRYLLHTYASFDMKLWIFLPSPCFTPLSTLHPNLRGGNGKVNVESYCSGAPIVLLDIYLSFGKAVQKRNVHPRILLFQCMRVPPLRVCCSVVQRPMDGIPCLTPI